ncbi:glycosyltransferase [Fluviibacter phosphoraccumulans]|uniref:glycosyltransferase n=1 Tax=Fluviibacter phosphoraccumulans TaxID=1751046 RepID=UPI0010B9A95D|nr:glycosyltransferase [Fluviibacter phosphoraccumulans]
MISSTNAPISKVAVLVATYNGAPFISSQFASLLSQINVDFDVYVRDDQSSDCTCQIVNDAIKCPSVVLVQDSAPSGSPAGNFFKLLSCIDLKKYDYIAFSDQDDVWFPEKLKSAINYIQHNVADAYSSDLIAFDQSRFKAWHLSKCDNQKGFDYLFQGASAGCTYVLSRNAAQLVLRVLGDLAHNFPVGHSHDWLIYAICRSYGLKWVHDNRAFVAYRQHSVNAFGAMPGIRGMLKRLRLSRSGWYREQIVWQGQFLEQSPRELRVLEAVKNFRFKDRFYLVMNVSNFRRSRKDCFLLAVVIVFGLL